MAVLNASLLYDANGNPVQTDGVLTVSNIKTLTGSSATVATPIFALTGIVELRAIWGIVTTDLGANHTAAAFRLNDQTTTVDITLSTGSAISAFKAGSAFYKKGLAGTAVSVINNSAGRANESTANLNSFSSLLLTKKTGATTNIEYVYATTDAPTSGALQFFMRWLPISADGNITVV